MAEPITTIDGLPTDEPVGVDNLDALESEAIHIFREVAGEFDRPVILFSGGKDSTLLLHLAVKAFWPAPVPSPPSAKAKTTKSPPLTTVPTTSSPNPSAAPNCWRGCASPNATPNRCPKMPSSNPVNYKWTWPTASLK